MRKALKSTVIAIIFAATSLVAAAPAHAADYSNSRLMDDQIFDNVNTMSEAQITSFIASKGPCLAGFADVDPNWNGSTWTYSGSVPAAHIIYKAAHQWGINPQVILATLQKEESLITGTSCDSWRYNSAMGYGCPDSGGCNPKYAGFTRQVLWGSWQLKFSKERSYGNVDWDGDGDINYVGYMTQGQRKRCNTCSLISFDGNATIDGQTIHLENGTTAALYTYTPHLGQAFPGIFESWFGSVMAPSYSSTFAGQSAYPAILKGSSATASLSYKNTGNQPWYDDATASANNAKPVHLATSHNMNRYSLVGTWWGGDQNRPAANFAAVYEADGVTLAANQHIAQPGQIAKFNILFFGPTNLPAGTYREFFQPIVEGKTNMNDPWTFLDVTIQDPIYASSYAGQSTYPVIPRGTLADSYFLYKNIGNQPWYDDTTASANNSKPVHLATSNPMNRYSLVGTWWRGDQNRPAATFGAVYEADGVTLAANQHIAQPGQIVKFNFKFFGPTNLPAGWKSREYFQPIVEGGTNMNNPGTFLDVTLQ